PSLLARAREGARAQGRRRAGACRPRRGAAARGRIPAPAQERRHAHARAVDPEEQPMRYAVIAGVALLLAAPQLARADDTPEWKTCISVTNIGAERLPACTAVIEGKTETGRRLAGAYCIRGNDLTEKGELDAALADLNEAIAIDPTYACAFNNRGRVYNFKRDYDRAIADYDEAIRLNPRFAIAFNNRGDAWHKKGDLDRAIADFTEALNINPNYAKTLGNRGWVYYRKRDYARALEDFSAEIKIAPSLLAYINRGNVYRDTG